MGYDEAFQVATQPELIHYFPMAQIDESISEMTERGLGGFRMMGNMLWVKLRYRHMTKN